MGKRSIILTMSLLLVLIMVISGCGGSGGSDKDTSAPDPTTVAPAAPGKLTVVTADSQLAVSWEAVTGATLYQVYYSTKEDSTFAETYAVVTTTNCVISGLTNGTTYYTWIKAQNAAGTSDFSPVASATPGIISGNTGYIRGLVNTANSFSATLVNTGNTQYYSSSAYYNFDKLAPGTYHLRLEQSGYASIIKTVTVPENGGVEVGALTFNTVLPKGVNSYATSVSRNSGGTTSFTLGYPQTLTISWSLRSDYPPFDEATATVQVNGSTIWSRSNDSGSKKSGTASVYSSGYGSSSIRLSGNEYRWTDCSLTVYYNVDDEAPAIALSKTWTKSTLSDYFQVSINCVDSSGIKTVQYGLTDSITGTPASWTTIPSNTAVQFTTAGVWFLLVKATDTAGNSYTRTEGPYIITSG